MSHLKDAHREPRAVSPSLQVHEASINIPLRSYFCRVFWLSLGQLRRASTEFFHFLDEAVIFCWARRSVGPEQVRVRKIRGKNLHRRAPPQQFARKPE